MEKKNLALLYEKMAMCEAPEMRAGESGPESMGTKASKMECLFAKLYEVEGEYAELAELLLVCMVQALILLLINDVERNRSLLPYIER